MNKTQLRALAVEVRSELSLQDHEPLDPLTLAEFYGIDVLPITALDEAPDALAHFTDTKPSVFSGALIPCADGSTVIIENDTHTPERRVSTLSHEMAHVLLEHPFSATLTDSGRCRVMNKTHEGEAAELGGELLIPSSAALRLAYNNTSDEAVAQNYRVSLELAAWRMNATGARKRAARAAAKRRRPS